MLVFQTFTTLDLVSGGKAELMVGRSSFVESFPLFGNDRALIQFSVGTMPHAKIMHSIELLGTVVAPEVRRALR